MRGKRLAVSVIAIVLIGSLGVLGAVAADMTVPLGNIELKAPNGYNAVRTSVTFSHSRHFIYKCTECHHTWKYDKPIVGCETAGCHDRIKPQKTSDPAKAVRFFRAAYHEQCIECHKKIKRANARQEASTRSPATPLAKTGPTGCVECHPN